jgi:hypothetical protein
MAKVAAAEIRDLGFIPEMFRLKTTNELDTYIAGIIDEQAALLEGRIGPALYAQATEPAASLIKRAEKCLAAGELLSRRIKFRLADVQSAGEGFSVEAERREKEDYRAEAETIITDRLTSGDFASGVVETTVEGG